MRDARVYPILGLGLLLLGFLMARQAQAPWAHQPMSATPVEVLVAREPWAAGSSAGSADLHLRSVERAESIQLLHAQQRSDGWSWRLKLTLVLVVLLFLIWDRGQRRRATLQL